MAEELKDVKMEGKSLGDYSKDRLTLASKLSDEVVSDNTKKPLKEDHFLKLYWFKTEHEKIAASFELLRNELQKYGASIIGDYFPGEKDAIINMEEKCISKRPLIEKAKVELELPK